MSDILTIKRALADRVGDVAQMLLPNGRKEGHEWRVGSIDGERGQSLGVHLTGSKAGVWADFSGGQSGDLLDLWMLVRSVPLTQALDQARTYLGLERHQPYREPRKQYTRPPKPRCVAPCNRVRDYLVQDRNLPSHVLDQYRIGEDGNRIVFPYLLPNGELVLAKVREATDGATPVPTAKDCEPILFGWQVVPGNAREIIITEGEIDALSMAAYGFVAVSVPFGGGGKGKQNWIENEFDRLEQFERIYIATDMDKVGEEAAAEIASRLGRHRCYRVNLPRKDANQCLMEGISREEIATCVASAQSLDPEGLRRPSDFADRVANLFWPAAEAHAGYSLPYADLNGRIMFRPGEVTLWSGATGSGKSQIISDCVPRWIREGSRICIASFEMQPQWTLKRMVKQAGGVDRPALPFLDATLAFLDSGLLLYEKVGKSGVPALLEIFDYARAKYGCDQFVIDSLMRLGIAADDYGGQEQAVFRIVDWTIAKHVHLHLVCHSRKPANGQGVPEAEDVKGAMEIGANAFNILTIWRNRKIEEMAGEPASRPEMTDEPGVTLNCAKQRNGDFEGKAKLYFNTRTYQYFSTADNRRMPRCYVPQQSEAA